MKVTALEVKNLLSFREFKLELGDGLTVVVGPNGAGKTNIIRVLDLVARLVAVTDERSAERPAPLTLEDALVVSPHQMTHDGADPNSPIEVKLGLQFTTVEERERIVAFIRAAILGSCIQQLSLKQSDANQLAAWIAEQVNATTLGPLFTGTLVLQHPGYENADWRISYEFEVNGFSYDWILFAPTWNNVIVAHGSVANPATPNNQSVSYTLFRTQSSGLPGRLLDFDAKRLCPDAGYVLVGLTIAADNPAFTDDYEIFREARSRLDISHGDRKQIGLLRALRLNLDETLVILGEKFRGVGLGSPLHWKSWFYSWEELAGSPSPREPAYLPLRLFKLRNSSDARQRKIFEETRKWFATIVPGRTFDVILEAPSTSPASASLASTSAGSVGDSRREAETQARCAITVLTQDLNNEGSLKAGRPIQLCGSGTWEALVLAEAVVRADDRFVVLDEPGASLHPTWQTAVRELLRQAPGQVLVVTHSPHLVPMKNEADLKCLVRVINDTTGSRCQRLDVSVTPEEIAKVARVFANSADARALLFARSAVIVSGETEMGALPIWFAKSHAAKESGSPEQRGIQFFNTTFGDSGFRPILLVLSGLSVPWVLVCDGKCFDVEEQNCRHHIFRQILDVRSDLCQLQKFVGSLGSKGGRMSQELFDEQVEFGRRYGVFTLASSWKKDGESSEDFVEKKVAPDVLKKAQAEVGPSKALRGRWIAEQTDCPDEVDELYRSIVSFLDGHRGRLR